VNDITAVQHVFDPIDTPAWISISAFSFVVALLAHLYAEKIPGVNKINHVPQLIALFSFGGAFHSFFLEIKLIGSIPNALKDLLDNISGALSGAWNITGIAISLAALIYIGLRYMGLIGEDGEQLKDAMLFGLIALVAAIFVPWINDAIEWWRYFAISGISNVIITILDTVANWEITS
jgi:hypothetical protein